MELWCTPWGSGAGRPHHQCPVRLSSASRTLTFLTIALNDLLQQTVVDGLTVTLQLNLLENRLRKTRSLTRLLLDVVEEVVLPLQERELMG